jgi:isochorismate hydrolase
MTGIQCFEGDGVEPIARRCDAEWDCYRAGLDSLAQDLRKQTYDSVVVAGMKNLDANLVKQQEAYDRWVNGYSAMDAIADIGSIHYEIMLHFDSANFADGCKDAHATVALVLIAIRERG